MILSLGVTFLTLTAMTANLLFILWKETNASTMSHTATNTKMTGSVYVDLPNTQAAEKAIRMGAPLEQTHNALCTLPIMRLPLDRYAAGMLRHADPTFILPFITSEKHPYLLAE